MQKGWCSGAVFALRVVLAWYGSIFLILKNEGAGSKRERDNTVCVVVYLMQQYLRRVQTSLLPFRFFWLFPSIYTLTVALAVTGQMQGKHPLSAGQHESYWTKWSFRELIFSARCELCHVVLMILFFFPFLGPTAEKTYFANLEELKMAHKWKHHSSVVGFYSLLCFQSQFKNSGLGKLYRFYGDPHLSRSL